MLGHPVCLRVPPPTPSPILDHPKPGVVLGAGTIAVRRGRLASFRSLAAWLVLGTCLGGVAPVGAADALPAILTGGTAVTPAAEKSERTVADIEARRATLQKEITATR